MIAVGAPPTGSRGRVANAGNLEYFYRSDRATSDTASLLPTLPSALGL